MASSMPIVFDEMPKRKERSKITIIQMQGHPIQTWIKSNTTLIRPGSFDTFESNKRCCPRGPSHGRPQPGPLAEPPRGKKSNTPWAFLVGPWLVLIFCQNTC
jgi:hypothetical protein